MSVKREANQWVNGKGEEVLRFNGKFWMPGDLCLTNEQLDDLGAAISDATGKVYGDGRAWEKLQVEDYDGVPEDTQCT